MDTLRNRCLGIVAFCALLGACATNPVTGKSDLMLVGESEELGIGKQQYAPMRQSEGGDYALDPGLVSYVQRVGNRLAAVSDRKLPYEFTVLNNAVPNAWALPGGKIAVNRGLLTELKSESELAAVLGHEIVHAAARHSAQQMSKGMLAQGGLLATQLALGNSAYGGLASTGAQMASELVLQKYGRDAELESDKFGMKYMKRAGYDVNGAVTLQETFVRLSGNKESDWFEGLFASHPPSQERVQANRKQAAKLGPGGEIGAEAYAAAMATTLAAKPAYDAYEEGRKALGEKQPDVALEKAAHAIKLVPGEGQFHALKGDAYIQKKNLKAATQAFTDAIGKNNSYFYYPLRRGLIAENQGNDPMAKSDLETSARLLPTGVAAYGLGNIASRANDLESARRYYTAATQAGGEVGKAAQQALAQLDARQSPAK
jgi:predicted Zn-dependent protease